MSPPNGSSLRYTNDMRQLGGILFILGACVIVFPVKDAVTGIAAHGPNGSADGLLPLFLMIGDVCVVALGLVSMCLAYLLLVRDYGSPTLTMLAILLEQTTFIEWITGMVNLGKSMKPVLGTPDGNYFFSTGLLTTW
eukprot:CAMPEP_0117082226 /NCGR_PEP_ID=MMETSP0472-20121206/57915_1 /TAXON_ID=693140 ORGANISM="Tiarina fusus, Strain LIS" /NCGR_SAMPLE_ID=MMETSP0472 /ASSEMBLY_ACC=CAM_ASM_000603 /LENGTH=136 /DNA_ID=CAMNT_0004810401 /DNA_START=109 /DNA_END=516 /DNA_ORIENTATION=+